MNVLMKQNERKTDAPLDTSRDLKLAGFGAEI